MLDAWALVPKFYSLSEGCGFMEDGVAVFYHLSVGDGLAGSVGHVLQFFNGGEDDVDGLLGCPVHVFTLSSCSLNIERVIFL
mmetsp:Transcript_39432/g.92103  ORF Transcript_39432/g.92103 Transcript_39432/m.92103 type:complete len:82 (+) Transcript_39432:879-1124(+)